MLLGKTRERERERERENKCKIFYQNFKCKIFECSLRLVIQCTRRVAIVTCVQKWTSVTDRKSVV